MKLPATFGGRRRWLFMRLILNGAGQAIAVTAAALLIQFTVDQYIVAVPEKDVPGLGTLALLLAVAGLVSALLRLLERVDAERLGQDYADRVRRRVFDKLTLVPPRMLSRRRRGALMLRFLGDLDALRRWLSMGLARLTVSGLLIGLTFCALAILNWQVTVTIFGALLGGVGASVLLGRPLEAAIREGRRRRSLLAGNVAEKITALAAVQANGQRERERRHMRRQSRRLKDAMVRRAVMVGGLRALSEGTVRIATILALFIGALQVAAGAATAGTVVAGMSVVAFLAGPIRDLGRIYDYWHAARVSREKVENFLKLPELIRPPRQPVAILRGPGVVEFQEVTVDGALHNISATAPAGKVTAVTGPNGAGKSTLIWLAARLMDPDHGHILLDGQRLSALLPDELQQAIGVVSSDIPLLRGTVDSNIRYRVPKATDAQVERVCKLCGIDRFIDDLPAGLQSRIVEGGANLSQGQRQRIALARAVLCEPKLLLLDEPETGLDPAAQMALDRVLETYRGTVMMVTHNSARAGRADVTWRLDCGQLVTAADTASGTDAAISIIRATAAPDASETVVAPADESALVDNAGRDVASC